MRLLKNIEFPLSLADPIGVYASPDGLLEIARATFEGKCYKQSYIVSINKIIRESQCVISRGASPETGDMACIFEATVVEFVKGEVITGCVITSRNVNGDFICATPTANIIIEANKGAEFLVAGNIVPAVVRSVRYPIGCPKMSVVATLFVNNYVPIVYKLGTFGEADKDQFAIAWEVASEEEKLKDSILADPTQKKAWDFFANLLYAYKDPMRVENAKPVDIADLVDLPRDRRELWVSRDPRINLNEPKVCVWEGRAEVEPRAIIRENVPAANVIILLIYDYSSRLRIIREMVKTYSAETFKAHANLWKFLYNSKAKELS